MAFHLFSAPEREPSQFVGFAGNIVERDSENRADDIIDLALSRDTTRILLSRSGRLLLRLEEGRFEGRFTLPQAAALGAELDQAVLLGTSPLGAVIMAPTAIEPETLPDGIKAIDYRSIYTQGLIDPEALGEVAQGAALLSWNASCRFCGRCGAPTQSRIGGYKRSCGNCGADHFPRTDPVAIMLTVTPDKCLMGRSPHFAPGMYSCLAGFVEPGETIEAAVRRETFEEAGIRLGRVAYHASQPWPFPHSLMIGCYGEALGEAIAFDGKELEDCRWFTRNEVRTILAGEHGGDVAVPPSGAIAHHLIRHWATVE